MPTILLGFTAGPTVGIVATIFTWLWSQVENNVIVPRVMGHAVKLNPLVVVVVDELHHERLLSEQEV